ncbi:hypothetical protein IX83_02100 [Basilea psittacipulmonis DSM 24701]|uniref:Glutamine ABC transporter substrate-bindnig protein n=1 Tax=Basilea psittacipulmonis DSM 24701 TaxID=1072685 RepID=A0A077DDR7_9BURK|nr:hypothetical protein IX83_02100 [Basilea psittacipulmonis DSM 24701]
MLKKCLASFLLLWACVLPSQAKTLQIGLDVSCVPFMIQKGNTLTGFDVEIWRAIAKKLDLEYNFQPMEFSGVIPGLQTRNLDVAVASLTINEKRKKIVEFSDPYYDAGLSALTRIEDKDKYNSLEALKGAKIAVKIGTSAVDFLKKNGITENITYYPNDDNMYLALKTHRVNAVVYDTPNLRYFAKVGGEGKVAVATDLVSDEQYGIAFPKGSKLVHDVNRALKEIREDGTYDAIYEEWFGSPSK